MHGKHDRSRGINNGLQWFNGLHKTAIGSLALACIYNSNVQKKQCVGLDEEIKTYNIYISYYGSVNSFKLSKKKIDNLEIILQRSYVISSLNIDINGFRQ